MSRWITTFENHPFQKVWLEIKSILDEVTADDQSVTTTVTELARLKKVIAYLDGILLSIDLELIPLNTWDNFQSQAAACLPQIVNYRDNKNIAHLQAANTHADNLLTYVRPYMIAPPDVKKVLQGALGSYTKTFEQYTEIFHEEAKAIVQSINKIDDDSNVLLSSIKEVEKSTNKLSIELFGDGGDVEGRQTEIQKLVEDFTEKHDEINVFHDETLVDKTGIISTKTAISQAKANVLEEEKNIKKLVKDSKDTTSELSDFYTKIFGKADENDEQIGGLALELDTRVKELNDFESKQKIRYVALNQKIEDLLPGAASAGLASAYNEMKISFNAPIKMATVGFYCALLTLAFVALWMSISSITFGGDHFLNIQHVEIGNWDATLRSLINKVPFYGPILWLAFFASRRRSEYQRLQQEYAHKEALAKSYQSYKKQLSELDDEDAAMQKEFIMKAVDAIAYNASITLDGKHGDKMPLQEIIEKCAEHFVKIKSEIIKPPM